MTWSGTQKTCAITRFIKVPPFFTKRLKFHVPPNNRFHLTRSASLHAQVKRAVGPQTPHPTIVEYMRKPILIQDW
jgi:hypothetical protein